MTTREPFSFYGWEEIPPANRWHALGWGYMQDKRYAVQFYGRLGLHPILLNGLLDDGACTCGRPDCDKSRGKHPIHKDWQSAPLDVDALDRALVTNWRFNVGLRCGLQPCGRFLVVVDVDGPFELIRDLETDGDRFPETLTARTGSGGFHLYYFLPEGKELATRAGILGKRPKEQGNIDIRADRGQVVAPPSLHLSGNKYTWIKAMEPAVLI